MKKMSFKEFQKAWKEKAYTYGVKHKVLRDSRYLMAYIVIFTEYICVKHHLDSGASREDLKYAGIDEIMKGMLKSVKHEDLVISLIYCGANDVFCQELGLKRDAFRKAIELYEESTHEEAIVKKEVLEKYSKNENMWINYIFNEVPDEILAKHLLDFDQTLILKKKEIKMISTALSPKYIDTVIVWRMEDNYNLYLEHFNHKKMEKATKETLDEMKKEIIK